MADKAGNSEYHTQYVWAKHMITIRRLYLDEDKTLKEVMRIMESEHDFFATTKMYKKHLREYNCRKNIRTSSLEIQAYQNMSSLRQRPDYVTLSNGQVVATDALTTHIARKLHRKQYPNTIKPSDRHYFIEAVYTSIRSYLLGRFHSSVTTEQVLSNMQETAQHTRKWIQFVQKLSDALDRADCMHLDETLVLMRQAPHKLSMIVERQPPNVIGNIFVLLFAVTSRRAWLHGKELHILLRIVKSLLNYGATALPAGHPLHQMLRGLARWDTDDMKDFTENTSTACNKFWELMPPGSPGRFAITNGCGHLSVATPGLDLDQSSSSTTSLFEDSEWTSARLEKTYAWMMQHSDDHFPNEFNNDLESALGKDDPGRYID